MAISLDNSTTDNSGTGASSSTLTPFTVSAGSNKLLLVGVANHTGSNVYPTGATWKSSAIDLIDQKNYDSGNAVATLYKMLAPSSGSGNVEVAFTGGNTFWVVVIAEFSGVDQVTPLGTVVTNSGSGKDANVTFSSAVGEYPLAFLCKRTSGDTPVSYSGQTNIENDVSNYATASANCYGFLDTEAGASSVVSGWTWPLYGYAWATIGVSMKPAAESGAWTPRSMMFFDRRLNWNWHKKGGIWQPRNLGLQGA